MSSDFKLRFDQMREGQPTGRNDQSERNPHETFETVGHVRNLCFVWPDGRKKFLNYAYLVSGEYLPDEGSITLIFTTDGVIIKGSGLDGLFEELLSHIPKKITSIDRRYDQTVTDNNMIVGEIIISPTTSI